jgi:hypothetical protein
MQSIICFNGGSGGDFLKSLCLQKDINYQITDAGMIEFNDHYFKSITEKIYDKKATVSDIDFDRVWKVDNSHYYFDFFNAISKNVYYIDYPDILTSHIIKTYINKRHNQDISLFLQRHLQSIPEPLRARVTVETAFRTFEILWMKNLSRWRNNKNLTAIDLKDLFDIDLVCNIVEQLQGHPINDLALLTSAHAIWISKNQNLHQLFL